MDNQTFPGVLSSSSRGTYSPLLLQLLLLLAPAEVGEWVAGCVSGLQVGLPEWLREFVVYALLWSTVSMPCGSHALMVVIPM